MSLPNFSFLIHLELGKLFWTNMQPISDPPGAKFSEFRIFPFGSSSSSISLPSFSFLPHLGVGYLLQKIKCLHLLLYTERAMYTHFVCIYTQHVVMNLCSPDALPAMKVLVCHTKKRCVCVYIYKVKLSCYCHAGDKGEKRYSSYSFLTLALDKGEWSASCPGHALLPGKGPLVPHWIGGWVGLRAGVDTKAKGKILCLCLRLNPGHPVCSQTLNRLSYLRSACMCVHAHTQIYIQGVWKLKTRILKVSLAKNKRCPMTKCCTMLLF
jgi:hypothetical protein